MKEYYIKVRSRLFKRNISLDNMQNQEILIDSIAEAIDLYYEKGLTIVDSIKKTEWICRTAVHKFMHEYKICKRFDFYGAVEFAQRFADSTPVPESSCSEEEFKEKFCGYCDEWDLNLLVMHWYYGYTFKELSIILNLSETALQQRHKRLLDKLKLILTPPKKLILSNLKIVCQF